MTVERSKPLERRRFLKRIGHAAGASLLPFPWAGESSAAQARPAKAAALKIAVLLPHSRRHPQLGADLMAGMTASFAAHENRVAGRPVVLAPVTYGTSQNTALEAAEKLIASGGADIVAGLLSRGQAARLAPTLHQHGVPLLVCDIGADMVRDGQEHPLIVRNSLGYWQANWAMGQWTARNLGTRVLISAGFHEAGYDVVNAFQLGFEAAGGTVASTHIANLPNGNGTLQELLAQTRDVRPDFIYALHSGRPAMAFLDFYRDSGLDRVAPLAAGGLLLENAASAKAAGILTALSWADGLERRGQAGTRPLAALGAETAQRIVHAVRSVDGDTRDGARFAQALASAAFDGPRGSVAIDPRSGETIAPIHLRRAEIVQGHLSNIHLARLDAPDHAHPALAALRASEKTGWLNAYLAA